MLSCSTVPPDVPAFHELKAYYSADPVTGHIIEHPSPACEAAIHEKSCGYGVYIMSGKEIFVGDAQGHDLNGKTWSQLKAESILLPAQESFAPLSEYAIDACAKTHCNDQVDRFRVLNGDSRH